MTKRASTPQQVYAEDKLAGLIFAAERGWCYFRGECEWTFNYPLDPQQSYALVDPETDAFVGICAPEHFVGTSVPPTFRVFLLRPLLQDLHRPEPAIRI